MNEPIDMSNEAEKSAALAALSGIELNGWDGHNLYLPENFRLTWEVVVWHGYAHFFDNPVFEGERKVEFNRELLRCQHKSLKETATALMDNILAISIEAGHVYGDKSFI